MERLMSGALAQGSPACRPTAVAAPLPSLPPPPPPPLPLLLPFPDAQIAMPTSTRTTAAADLWPDGDFSRAAAAGRSAVTDMRAPLPARRWRRAAAAAAAVAADAGEHWSLCLLACFSVPTPMRLQIPTCLAARRHRAKRAPRELDFWVALGTLAVTKISFRPSEIGIKRMQHH